MQNPVVDAESFALPEDTEDRVIAPEAQLGEQYDLSLRPERLQDYIGQTEIKENLEVFIGAAKKRGHALDHVLLSGPPGLGKTTLANIFAREMEVQLRSTSGPVIERQGDLAAILTNLEPGSILFIDEIHRMNRVVEEVLYGAMEDFTLDIIIGEGPGARTVKIDLPHFTLVGATTRAGLLSSPLRDRFGIQFRLNFYEPEELKTIVLRAAALLGIEIMEEASLELGRRARGTPRIANRLLKRCRDFADMETAGIITLTLVENSLAKMRIDLEGLDQMDRHILETIIEKFNGGPVGLNTLSAAVSEEKDTIEDVYEPFLLLKGFLQRTPRGRIATKLAYEHFGISTPPESQANFF
ncbi:MAG: Holliday junction branch migration DNA helicase RuvB [SAR324 cluster bacterium]|nr:Holliday junction branch migration DNA helicase RuvB [SAR324 cluster bacterium]MBL7035429.1 Holliday junction branch migration DNA helicase RuvB [SAR324 cluster bacterium]